MSWAFDEKCFAIPIDGDGHKLKEEQLPFAGVNGLVSEAAGVRAGQERQELRMREPQGCSSMLRKAEACADAAQCAAEASLQASGGDHIVDLRARLCSVCESRGRRRGICGTECAMAMGRSR